jgi:hypothetical protein
MKRKLQLFAAMAVLMMLVAISCTKDSGFNSFGSSVDVTGSSLAKDQGEVILLFSTDKGATYTPNPTLSIGQGYKAIVIDRVSKAVLNGKNFFTIDWSTSKPAPSTPGISDTASFTFQATNNIAVTVTDKLCTYTPASWTGKWGGDEVGACCGGTDKNNITEDTTDPNKFIMDNFWGDGVDAYIIFAPSTTLATQTLTLPMQTTSEGGVASGTGTYDQCRGTFTINTTYDLPGVGTFNWQYNFHR